MWPWAATSRWARTCRAALGRAYDDNDINAEKQEATKQLNELTTNISPDNL